MSAAAVAFQSPKYIQQAGALKRVGEFAAESFKDARKAGILTSARLRSRYMEAMCQSVDSPVIAEFSGECSRSNLQSILGKMQGQQLEYIIGFGGGKLLDMAKLVRCPACLVPDCSSLEQSTTVPRFTSSIER
jgi:glycerol dehydrogenase-like iron-containing ADH family enzyme